MEEFFPLLRLAVDACADLRRKIRVKRLDFHLTLAGEDPCSLALNYGRAWAIAGNTVMLLQRLFTIEKQDVQVSCDFAGDKSRVRVQAEIRICLGRLVGLGAVYGVRLLKEYWKRNQKGKGGAEHESETSQHAGNNHPKNP